MGSLDLNLLNSDINMLFANLSSPGVGSCTMHCLSDTENLKTLVKLEDISYVLSIIMLVLHRFIMINNLNPEFYGEVCFQVYFPY